MVRAVLGIAYLAGVAIAAGAIGVGPPGESLRVPPGEATSVSPGASDITGRIERIFVDEGDLVTAGQPLAQLEQTAYRARMEADEAAVRAAHARWERLQSGARPEEIRKAQAQLTSPITGTVVRRNLRPGQAVSSFQVEPVVTVADLTRLRVRAEVDEFDIGKVHLGRRVRAEAEPFPGLLIEGRVVRLGRTMGRKTVKAQDPNERQDVRVREVLIDLDITADLPLGLRLGVSFLE